MTDFKIEYSERLYATFFESSEVIDGRLEAKVIMYSTVYRIWKDLTTGEWHNHISKYEFSPGLLAATGAKIDEYLKST